MMPARIGDNSKHVNLPSTVSSSNEKVMALSLFSGATPLRKQRTFLILGQALGERSTMVNVCRPLFGERLKP